MHTSTLKFTSLENQIFRFLCIKAGEHLNQRELSRHIKATPSGIAKALPALKSNGLILIEKNKTMNLNLVTLNRTQKTLKLKKIENLKQIYETELTEHLEEKFPGSTIVLFGSYARGEDTTKSDIDIAIFGAKPKYIDLEIFEKKLERNININHYKNLKNIHTELKENICNGINLFGGLDL